MCLLRCESNTISFSGCQKFAKMESILKNLAKSQPTNILLEVSNSTTSIHIGETEIKIATSKLTSLISFLLDKDEDMLESRFEIVPVNLERIFSLIQSGKCTISFSGCQRFLKSESRFEIVPVNLDRIFSLIQCESGKCRLLKKEKQKIGRCRLFGCTKTKLGSRFVAKPCKCKYTFIGKSLYFTETSQDGSTLRGTVSDVSSDETVDGNELENTSTVSKRSTNSSSSESNTSITSTKRSASSSVEKKSPTSGKKVPTSGKKSPPSAKDLAKSPPTKILMEVSNKTTSIHIGETEKKIATSKLTSLISSLLDKDEDRPHSFHGKQPSTSPEKSTSGSKSSVTSVSADPNNLKENSEKIRKITKIQEIPAFGTSMGTSPANFSFLSDLMKEKENNENVGAKTLPDKFEIDPLIRERSHSASKLNDIKKIHKRMVSEGSSENSPLVSQNTTSSSDTGSEKVIAETEEDDSNKAKYRRCSSLRSGKTPPGTPGRRKIVR